MNADIIADVQQEQVALLQERVEAFYCLDGGKTAHAVAHRAAFSLLHCPTLLAVTVFSAQMDSVDSYDSSRMARRSVERMGDDVAAPAYPLASAEDIILAKLQWFHQGNGLSDEQWRDIMGVAKLQGEQLDMAYLHRWAATLNVANLLERALQDAGLEEMNEESKR